MVDTAAEVYDMVDDQYYEVIEMCGGDEATDASRMSTSDWYLLPVRKDKSSEHHADHTVQTDTDCMENSTSDIDGVTITEKDINCSANCDFAYIANAEIVYNTEPIVVKL